MTPPAALVPLQDALVGARLLWRLPSVWRHPISPEKARAIVRRRLERREADFLALARHAIYAIPHSPYRALLFLIGCEYGDLERLVDQQGLEGALQVLCRQGVYLTVDELKGRRPVVRGSATIGAGSDRLRNPRLTSHVMVRSSGSRGGGTSVPFDLATIRALAVNYVLTLHARGGDSWLHAQWGAPGSYIPTIIRFGCFGARHARWFSQVDPRAHGLSPRYRWSVRALRTSSALLRAALPPLEYVSLENPLPIIRWLSAARRAGETPSLYTYVSAAVRLARAAEQAGIDFRGVQLTVTGEPITPARLAAIRRSGATVVTDYGGTEAGGFISYGCLDPAVADEVHLMHDLHAMIQVEPSGDDGALPPGALLITSLRATAPLILLNASLGDWATVENRRCGCPIERLGWPTHLHSIRSFEKLTAGGMTFLDTDVIRVLEEVLPRAHGGGPTDYQLLEDTTESGEPRLRLLVRPSIEPLDPAAVADTFLTAIGSESATERMMALLWRQAGLLTVERRQPLATSTGKIQHLVSRS